MSVTTEGTVETIRKESVHSYDDGETCDTEFVTVKHEDTISIEINQEYCDEVTCVISDIVLNESEMLVLYWHLQAVLGKDK